MFRKNVIVTIEKNGDEYDAVINKLKNQINTLEKTNFRLKIDNRDAEKDNRNLIRRKSKENLAMFIPKSRVSSSGKENKRIINMTMFDNSINKTNFLEKIGREQKFEIGDSLGNGSNSGGSVIINTSYVDDV